MGKISKAVRGIADIYNGASLIVRIIVGLIIGTVLALTMPHVTGSANSAPCSWPR